jgi:hypothetical protein
VKWWRRRAETNGTAVRAQRAEQTRRLEQARRQWPEVHEARDVLGSWVEQALRGRT